MDYVIYTYGGGEVLWKIFNGLSIFFKSDSAYLTGVVKLSMVIGGLWAALRAIYSGSMGILARDYFIPTYLILNLFLLPKTSVHIVDEVSSDFKYSKIDHVPIGIAAVTSTASKLSRFITDRIENSLKTAEATHFGKTGPMFAAKLVAMSRDVRIIDPVERQNMKDFVRQCFTLPMVWTNILAGKKAALETDNILKLIAENPHSWLGSYWRTKGGDTEFLYCKGGVAKAREILNVEVPNGLTGLATDLFGNNKMDGIKSGQKLKTYFDTAWEELSHQAASAHEVAAQEMMMNAYREGLDDKRQEFGLERLNPHLVAYSSARARMQQNTGFLISSNLFALVGPSLQSTLFGILCVLFVIVVPMAMLPGGLTAFGMWVKLIIWVESWPVFYAIINCVSMMIASGKTTAYVKTGAGLSLLTQNGLADAAYDAYCYAEGFMCMVPVIAWAVISKSGYALANLAGTVTRGVDSLSSKMGSELVDGNMSFDNQSFHHRSVAGYQVAQQQLAPNFSFGSKYDDGSMSVTWDTKGGSNIQETLTNLGTHVALTDNLSASMTESGEKSLQASHNYSRMSSESLNQGLQKLYSYGDQFTRGHGVNHKFGSSQDVSEGQEWKATMDLAHKFALDNRISDQESFQVLAEAGVDTGALKFVGIKAGINTQARHDSSTSALIDEAKSSGLAEQFGKHLTSAYKHAAGTDGSLSDQSQKSVLDSVQGNFQKAKMYQEQSQASLTRSENYRKAAAIIQSMGGTITTNLDKQILKDIADKSFNGNETQAYNWYVQNPEAYRQHAADFITKKIQPFMDMLNENHPMSEGKIRGALNEYFGKVLNTVGDSDINTARGIAMKNEMGEKNKQKMGADFNALKKETDSHMKQPEATLDGRKGHIENEYQRLKTSYDDKKAKGIMMPNVEKIPAIGNIGNEISKPDDFGTPTSSYQTMNNPSVSQPSSITIEKPSSTKGGASITSIYSPARPQETSLPHNTSSGDRVSSGTGEQPSFSSQTVQNKRENTSMKGTTHESPSFREATPGVKADTQPSYVQIESDIRQHNAQNKLTHQENQIRKLKDSIELSKAQSSSEDEPFEIVSSQTMDKW